VGKPLFKCLIYIHATKRAACSGFLCSLQWFSGSSLCNDSYLELSNLKNTDAEAPSSS